MINMSTIPVVIGISGLWAVAYTIVGLSIPTGIRYIFDIRIVFTAYPLTWVISSIIYTWLYKKGDWMNGKVELAA